jgi:hypothetical protein
MRWQSPRKNRISRGPKEVFMGNINKTQAHAARLDKGNMNNIKENDATAALFLAEL